MRLEKVVDEIPDEPLQEPELLFHLYRTLDWSQREIAYELDVDKSHVLGALIRYNVLQPWSDEEALKRALDDGNSPAEIADAWSCSELTIRRWMDRHGIKKRAELTESLLRELYQDQMLTVDEIAEDLGYAPVEVYFAIKEHGIETRDGSHRFRS